MKTEKLILLFFLFTLTTYGQSINSSAIPEEVSQQMNLNNHKKNCGFVSNDGQLTNSEGKPADNVLSYSIDADMRIYLTTQGLSFVFQQADKEDKGNDKSEIGSNHKLPPRTFLRRIDLSLLGSNITKENISCSDTVKDETINCYNGSASVIGAKKCRRIVVSSVYNGIDFAVYFDKDNHFKYEFIVHPNASVSQIKMKYDGDEPLKITNESDLIKIKTSYAEISDGKLFCYQNNNDETKTINSSYVVKNNNEVAFKLGHYNHSQTLVIDPLLHLIWGTYIGGSGLDAYYSCVTDNNGNLFATGITQSSNFPVMFPGGSYSQSYVAQNDVIISKFSPAGVLLWSTFFGGSDFEWGNDIAVDLSGNVFITGQVISSNFPFLNAGGGAYFDNTVSGSFGDAFLAKFTNGGALVHCTAIGGNYEDVGYAIKTDGNGNIYIVGRTYSDSNFPLLYAGFLTYYQPAKGSINDYDGFIEKFGPSLNQIWGTYYGGNSFDQLADLEVDASNNLYIFGFTNSTNMPVLNPGGTYFQGTNAGSEDNIIEEFNPSGIPLWCTYFGGAGDDQSYHMEIDLNGNIYFTGSTDGGFPTVALTGAYNDATYNGGLGDAFLAKFNPSNNLTWSTYVGGSLIDHPYTIISDYSKRVYIAGETNSPTGTFPLVNPGSGAYYDGTFGGTGVNQYWDLFICQFSAGDALTWSTYYGGVNDEGTPDLAVYGCNLLVTCQSISTGNDLANLGGAFYQGTNAGSNDAQILEFNIYDPAAYANAGPDIHICTGNCAVIGTNYGIVRGISFNWAPSTGLSCTTCQTPLACPTVTTTYTVTTSTASNCTASDQVTVFVTPPPTANAGPDYNLFSQSCGGGFPTTIGTPNSCGCTFNWSPSTYLSNPNIAQPSLLNNTTNNTTITYTLTVTDNVTGCQSTDQATMYFCNFRLANPSDSIHEIKIYPNPSNGHFTLEHSLLDPITSFEVLDISGKLICKFNPDNNISSSDIDLTFVEKGSYFVRIKTESTEKTERIIIE